MKMCVHIDGSIIRHVPCFNSPKSYNIGWGIVINQGESERYGGMTVDKSNSGSYEIISFIEAVIYAISCGVKPEDFVVYTDDQVVAYAGFYFWEGNYSLGRGDEIREKFASVLKSCYSLELLPAVEKYLTYSRIHKLKGHIGLVYQERANYLAKASAYVGIDSKKAVIASYDSWLNEGFIRYRAGEVVERVYPKFVNLES